MLVELEIKDVEIRINETFRVHEDETEGGRDERYERYGKPP